MKLLKTAFLLSSLLFISVSGGRKSHHHKTSSVSPSTTSIVESDAMPAASSQAPVSMAQSRSSAINERSQGGGYSQQIYSDPFDPAMMSASSIPEASYYEPPVPTPHHHSHHHAAAAAGHYHHHVPAPPIAPHARHAGAGPVAAGAAGGPGSYAAASSVAPYAAVPYHQPQGYYGYGYDYPPGRYAAQGSAHQDAYVGKRAHGYGGGYGWHPDLEIQTLFFIGIPLIIIPLLFLWPYFLYSLHSRGGGHSGGWGGYRAASGTPEVVATPEKVLEAKTEELTKKIVPKLSKKSVKSSSKSSKTK